MSTVLSIERIAEIGKQHEPSAAAVGHSRNTATSSASLPPALQLQQMAGNLAVQRLLRSGAVQAKLTISQSNDPDEQEADRIADQVMRMAEPESPTLSSVAVGGETIQRKCAECPPGEPCPKCEEEQKIQTKELPGHQPHITPEVESSLASLGGGQPLPAFVRSFFEPRFGMDFGRVRVHTGAVAEATAKSINARAFTVGRDITFGTGQYAPESLKGRRLLAHELTHTLQQATISRLTSQGTKVSNVLHARPSQTGYSPVGRGGEGEARSTQPPIPSGSILQRTDTSIQRLTIPFITTKADQELVKDGLGGDIVAINEIRNLGALDVPTRFQLLDRLIGQGAQEFGGRDSSSVYKIWASFGDLEATANANVDRWKKSTERAPQLASLPRVTELKNQFSTAVLETAKSYINTNRGIIRQEQIKYGVLTFDDEKPGPIDDEQRKNLVNMQSAAEAVAKNQKAQEAARQTLVGYKYGGSAHGSTFWIAVTFDPYQKPDRDSAPTKDYPEPKTTWDKMNAAWEDSVASTRKFLEKFPALYAVSREASSALTTSFVNQQTPEQARKFLSRAMEALIKDIQAAEKALSKDGKLNPLDLTPIAEGLLEGKKNAVGSSVEWGKPFASTAGREAIKDHQFAKALNALGYTVAAEALFILAPFTGPASVFLMLGGLAILGAKAGESQQQFEMLSPVAKTGVTPGTQLVTDKEVSMAAMEAQADKTALALAALTAIGAAVIGAISTAVRAARLRALVPDPVQLIRLRQLALGDEAGLLELLRNAKNPAEAEDLLIKMGTIKKAMDVLSIRERFSSFRAKYQSRLDANPDLEKLVQKAEKLAADPTKAREGEKILDDVAEKIELFVRQELSLPPVTNVIVDEAKFEFVFGKASPDLHNKPRSEQNVNYMNAIGLHDTAESRAILRKHLEQVPYDPKNLVKVNERPLKTTPTEDVFSGSWGGPTEIRESLVDGPGGSVKLQSFWEVRYGTRRLTSVRPHDVQPVVRQPNIAPTPNIQRAPN